jgi:uncharacterized protein YjbJ (UPF0337 family)
MALDDKVEGKLDQAKGTVKEKLGERTGDASLEAEGQADQAKGKVKDAWGDAKDAVNKGADAITGH